VDPQIGRLDDVQREPHVPACRLHIRGIRDPWRAVHVEDEALAIPSTNWSKFSFCESASTRDWISSVCTGGRHKAAERRVRLGDVFFIVTVEVD